MAAKGYVVLFTNPRGSTSYGQDFGNIIQYHYPGDDYKDLMAGVDEVLKRGYVDPPRLGVTGGSGGGLLTNWTITQTQRFKAAVAQRDIADWYGFWFTADFTLFQPTWFRKAPWEDPQDFAARSPITHVANVTTPLMLVLGDQDYRTPPADGGEMMFRALKYRKIPTVMVRFPRENHELSRSGEPWHRVERLQHIVGWMDQWLQGKTRRTARSKRARLKQDALQAAEPALRRSVIRTYPLARSPHTAPFVGRMPRRAPSRLDYGARSKGVHMTVITWIISWILDSCDCRRGAGTGHRRGSTWSCGRISSPASAATRRGWRAGWKRANGRSTANPKHAEALVWHGAGPRVPRRHGVPTRRRADGMELWGRGLAEMDEAVALEPDNVAVRIPRGAMLLQATRNLQPPDGEAADREGARRLRTRRSRFRPRRASSRRSAAIPRANCCSVSPRATPGSATSRRRACTSSVS